MRYAFFCVLVIGRGQRKTEDDPKISSSFFVFFLSEGLLFEKGDGRMDDGYPKSFKDIFFFFFFFFLSFSHACIRIIIRTINIY